MHILWGLFYYKHMMPSASLLRPEAKLLMKKKQKENKKTASERMNTKVDYLQKT